MTYPKKLAGYVEIGAAFIAALRALPMPETAPA